MTNQKTEPQANRIAWVAIICALISYVIPFFFGVTLIAGVWGMAISRKLGDGFRLSLAALALAVMFAVVRA